MLDLIIMHRVILTCAVFVSVNSVVVPTHSSHSSPHTNETRTNRILNLSTRIPQASFLPGSKASDTDAVEVPPPPPEAVLPPTFAGSSSIPVDAVGRPLIFPGTASHHPLPKCCPRGYELNESFEKCIKSEGRVAHKLALLDWEPAKLQCGYGTVLRLGSVEAARYVRQLMDERISLTVQGENGTLEVALSRGEFCADAAAGPFGPFALFLCPCKHTTCLRKCCSQGELLTANERTITKVEPRCQPSSDEGLDWAPRIEIALTNEEKEILEGKGEVHHNRKGSVVLEGTWPSECPSGLMRVPPSWSPANPGFDFKVFQTGLAVIMSDPPKATHNYCVDFERRSTGLLVESIVYCAKPFEVPSLDAWMSALGILGALALLATIVTHCVLADMRATSFGRALMSYAATHLLVAVVGLSWTLAPNVSKARCIFNIIWSQYFQLASAFWLSVMCYDMGIAFRSYQGPYDRMGSVATRRFIRYSQYSWGCPLIVTITMLCLQFTHPPGHPWRPIEYYLMCNYSSPPHFLFLYVPTLILLILNLAQFVWIACRIRFLQKDSAILTENEDSPDSTPYLTRTRLLLFLKLLWVMGVFESALEISVWATSSEIAYWHIANVVDMSRSLSIFALSCCKPRVICRLRERLCCGFCIPKNRVAPLDGPRTTTTGSGTSGTDLPSSRFTGAAFHRNMFVSENRKTEDTDNPKSNTKAKLDTDGAGNSSTNIEGNRNPDIASENAPKNRSPKVRINPFSEPLTIPTVPNDGNRNIDTDLAVSAGLRKFFEEPSFTMQDQFASKEIPDDNCTLKVADNETIIPRMEESNSLPTGQIEMRVISTTSL